MSSSTPYSLETKIGLTHLIVTQGDHIYAQPTQPDGAWIINGVGYQGSFHCNCYDGVWQAHKNESGHDWDSVHLYSRPYVSGWPSEKAKEKAKATLAAAIGAWAAAHPVELAQAELDYRRNLLGRAENDQAKAAGALDDATRLVDKAREAAEHAAGVLDRVKQS